MKKILVVLTLLFTLSLTAQAQFLSYGFRGGVGMGVHLDDLATNRPILAANVGGFVNFGFTNSQSLLAENFYLQTGLNLIRRGSNFEEVLESIMSIRKGTFDAWYVQLPVLAMFRYEMPIREPGHYALLSLGPAVSYGLFGTLHDVKITPRLPQSDWNYDITQPVFDVQSPLDVSFLFGVGYEYQDLTAMLQLDYGLTAVSSSPDALNISQDAERIKTVPIGSNFAILLTIGYQFPIR
jgi:hypothetical protein